MTRPRVTVELPLGTNGSPEERALASRLLYERRFWWLSRENDCSSFLEQHALTKTGCGCHLEASRVGWLRRSVLNGLRNLKFNCKGQVEAAAL